MSKPTHTRNLSNCKRHRMHSGFTLIEVLVVVAIIALLISILLPSLANAREVTRRVVCGTQLAEMGKAMCMYGPEHKDFLPGPIHGGLELETTDKSASYDHEIWHLPSFLRRYFKDRSKQSKLTDNVVRCPTADKIVPKAKYVNGDPARAFTYALNNNRDRKGLNGQQWFGTDPEMYFGWPDDYYASGVPDANKRFPVNPNAPTYATPKKLSQIRQLGREWAIADAFCYSDQTAPKRAGANSTRRPGDWLLGTYQNKRWVEVYMTNTPLPRAPYHDKGVNVVMFDGHAEYQRVWTGSVNFK